MAEDSRPLGPSGDHIRPHRQLIDGRPVLVIDAEFMEDPRVEQVSAAAFRLYLASLCYAAANDSGFIPDAVGRALAERWGQ